MAALSIARAEGSESRRRRVRRLVATLLTCVLAVAGVAEAASVRVRIERDAGGVVIEAHATVASDVVTAWRVLTDYEHYPAFVPDVVASRVVSRRGDDVVVRQTAEATTWTGNIPVELVYRIRESPSTSVSSQASSAGVPLLDSRYELARESEGVALHYRGRVTAAALLVGPIGSAGERIERHFRALADAIERASAARAGHGAGGDLAS